MEQAADQDQVLVVAVPLPAQGHLNQMLQLSCIISGYGIPVHYLGFAVHNRQAQHRAADTFGSPTIASIHFHDIDAPPIASPPPDPNSPLKYPLHLQPAFEATLSMQEPVGAYLHEMSRKFKRVIVVHDASVSAVVKDVVSIDNAESYVLNCLGAFFMASADWKRFGEGIPLAGYWKGLPTIEETMPPEIVSFGLKQIKELGHRSGDLFNTCRAMEGPFLDQLKTGDYVGDRKSWAIGPILPTVENEKHRQNECLQWLDEHDPKSVIYVSFGTTTSLSNAEVKEVAEGLENSRAKFLWVLRDADKGNIYDGEVRRLELPEGFEERTKGVGKVVRDWAPQPEILAHPGTGGFMSHCGWNSCIESITMGVPIAAFPMHSDQPLNAVLITEVLKTGVWVSKWKPRLEFKASTIESAVTRLMASEEGNEVRNRAEELAAEVRKATQPGGDSRVELDSFIAHITR